MASFDHHIISSLQRSFHRILPSTLRHRLEDPLEAQNQTLKPLKKGVVEITGYPLSLFKPCIKLFLQPCRRLFQAQEVQQPKSRSYRYNTDDLEPPRLLKRRLDDEGYDILGALPGIIAVRRQHPKAVVSGS